jgi:hypothetical protein
LSSILDRQSLHLCLSRKERSPCYLGFGPKTCEIRNPVAVDQTSCFALRLDLRRCRHNRQRVKRLLIGESSRLSLCLKLALHKLFEISKPLLSVFSKLLMTQHAAAIVGHW